LCRRWASTSSIFGAARLSLDKRIDLGANLLFSFGRSRDSAEAFPDGLEFRQMALFFRACTRASSSMRSRAQPR